MRRFRRRQWIRPWQFRWPLRLPGGLRLALLFLVAAYLLVRTTDWMVAGPLAAVAETEARQRAIAALNRIVISDVAKTASTQQLITYEKDQQGRIAAYHVNTSAVNHMSAAAAALVQNEFAKMQAQDFAMPIGAFTGLPMLAAWGPRVPVRLMPIGSVVVDIKQEFKEAGINQTRHRIWLHGTASVRVILPMVTREVTVTADVPVTETVIVGPVPNSLYSGTVGGVTLPAAP